MMSVVSVLSVSNYVRNDAKGTEIQPALDSDSYITLSYTILYCTILYALLWHKTLCVGSAFAVHLHASPGIE